MCVVESVIPLMRCGRLGCADCVVEGRGGCSAPMCMLENISRGMSSGGDVDLMVGCGEVWREAIGLIDPFPSDIDVEASASWCCGMRW